MRLTFLRHGLTAANEQHLYCGSTDLSLSEAGKTALDTLRSTVPYPSVEGVRVLTSGMQRCEETLVRLYGDVPHTIEPAFREMAFGAFEMRSYNDMKDDPAYITWISGDNEANQTPGGESGCGMKQRVLEALDRLLADGQDVLVVTHGGVIAAIMEHLFPEAGKNRYEWQPKAGCGYTVDTGTGTYTVLA